MLTGTALNRDDLSGWVRACWTFLIQEREATIDEVEQAFHDHLAAEKWFPRIADLVPRVETLVKKRLDLESTKAAYRELEPKTGLYDWSDVPTWHLPDDHDWNNDPHYQRGLALMAKVVAAKGDLGPLGNMAREWAQRKQERDESAMDV